MAGWKAGFMGAGLVGLSSLFGGCTLAPYQATSPTRLVVVEPVHYHQPRPAPQSVTVVTMPAPIVATSTHQHRQPKPASYGVQQATRQRVQPAHGKHPQHPAHPLHPEHPAHPQHPLRPQNTVAVVKQSSRAAAKRNPPAAKPSQPGKPQGVHAKAEKGNPQTGKAVNKPATAKPANKPAKTTSNNQLAAEHASKPDKPHKERASKNGKSAADS